MTSCRQKEGILRETNSAHFQRLQRLFKYYFHGTPLQDLKVASSSGLISFPGAPSQFRHLDVKLELEPTRHAVSFLMQCTHHTHLHVWRGSTTMLEAVAGTRTKPLTLWPALKASPAAFSLHMPWEHSSNSLEATVLPMETVVLQRHSIVVLFSHLIHAGAAWSSIKKEPNIQLHAYFSAGALPANTTVPLPRWLQWATKDALQETEQLEVWLEKRNLEGCG
eukprot:CAMPEP_0202849072 /NCGR_PEP_ID=MMETSP1389-20130828/79726_1 /ASSEMBLY_ACC=CAM_ASM_000865 /TAXON_ID=302021 /ORGANISM="Rhodomonas sp., Strain CCMP768" /LENGTH=221 /DNA_ID=CAMNT_0049527033 /DNA_START=96 /DNA_END=756 /DNA_ORIENTATION=-